MYDSRSDHARKPKSASALSKYYLHKDWEAEGDFLPRPTLTRDRAVREQVAAVLDLDLPATEAPGLKRLANDGTWQPRTCRHHLHEWEATLLGCCWHHSHFQAERQPTREEEVARQLAEDEASGLEEARMVRDSLDLLPQHLLESWEGEVPENLTWCSDLTKAFWVEVWSEQVFEDEVEYEDEADLDYDSWLPYMTQAEFEAHMDGGWHTGGWSVVRVS